MLLYICIFFMNKDIWYKLKHTHILLKKNNNNDDDVKWNCKFILYFFNQNCAKMEAIDHAQWVYILWSNISFAEFYVQIFSCSSSCACSRGSYHRNAD